MAARAMATMAIFLLLALLLPVPGAQAQESRCSLPCTSTYGACMVSCVGKDEPCGQDCEKARDACTGICDRDCAYVAPPGSQSPVLNCTTAPCTKVYDDCFTMCTTGGGKDVCPSACNGAKEHCIGLCQSRCAIV